VYRLALPSGQELPYHRFRQGDNILLSPMDSLSTGQARGSAGSAKSTAAAARARLARGRGADGQGQCASSEGDSDSGEEEDWAGIDGVVLELRRGHLMVAVEGKQADVIQRFSTAGAGGGLVAACNRPATFSALATTFCFYLLPQEIKAHLCSTPWHLPTCAISHISPYRRSAGTMCSTHLISGLRLLPACRLLRPLAHRPVRA
jgi:hypothetical protein